MNPQPRLEPGHVTEETEQRERFVLYRLCDCIACEGTGKAPRPLAPFAEFGASFPIDTKVRCSECRGEGRVRQELATCESPEAIGVAIVTLAREGEFEECPIGLLERGAGKNGAGRWLILPWLPSPRNASDAGKLLRSRRK